MAEFCAQYPCAVESVGMARRAITGFARQWFAGEQLTDIESAVGEALANSAEHGHSNGTLIAVQCTYDQTALSIEITDAGSGFDRWDATDRIRPLSNAPRGYGMYIMVQLMDEVEYSDHGRRLRLLKRRASTRKRGAQVG